MPICARCGADNPDGFRFCGSCAAALSAPSQEVRKTVTVLFCDVTGSTALGEQLDSEALRRVMLRYFETVREVIERHGGTVEKFIGDAVMAVFGVPRVHEDDALRAASAAIEVREALSVLNAELARAYGATLEVRIGINSGEVVTGSDERLATGDAVNVAARLEQAAQPGEIVLGENTVRLVRAAAEVELLEPLAVKGKAEPLRAARLVSVTAPVRPLDAPMVGRRSELERLRQEFGDVVRDRVCRLSTVVGEAGVGKSRLVACFLETLEAATVVRGRCLPYGDGISYWPVVEVVKRLPAADLDTAASAAIRGLIDSDVSPTTSEEIAWGFRKLLEANAREQPLVCVFDDLQWGEDTFLDLVEQFGYLSQGSPILLLCMARPELFDRRPAWQSPLRLEPLSADQSEELVQQRLGGVEVEAAQHERILAAAEGNPLFLEEMVAVLLDSGDEPVEVPPTIHALLAARLDQLDPVERAILERGAVEGEVFHRGAVQALGPDELQLSKTLTALVRKDLLRPDSALIAGDDAFRFRHLLIRDAAYESLPKAARARMHQQFANWLEAAGPGLAEIDELLGYHRERAYRYLAELGPTDDDARALAHRAGTSLLRAGRAALVRKDVPAAITLLARGVNLLPEADPDRIKGLVDLGEAHHWGARGALAILDEAIALAQSVGDERLEAWARLFRNYDRDSGVTAEQRSREAEALAAVFVRHGDDAGVAHAWLAVAGARLWLGRVREAEAALARFAEFERRTSDRRRENLWLGLSLEAKLAGATPVSDAIAFGEQLLEQGGEARFLACFAALAELHAMAGNAERAYSLLAQGMALAEAMGLPAFRARLIFGMGTRELRKGDLAAAELEFRRAWQMLEDVGDFTAYIAPTLADVLLRLGRDEEAARLLDDSFGELAQDDVEERVLNRATRARIHARRGELATAELLVQEAVSSANATELVTVRASALLALADVLERLGRPADAAAAIQGALEFQEAKGDVVAAAQTRALEVRDSAGV